MKIFANKKIWQKIVIIFLLILSINFIMPEPAQASWGGTLMAPICDMLVGFGDGLMNIMHKFLVGQDGTIVNINLNDSLLTVIRWAITIAVFIAVMVIAAVLTAGASVAANAVLASVGLAKATAAATIAASAIASHIVPIIIGATYFGVQAYRTADFNGEINLPMYSVTPEAIFSNEIPLFDVNFFNPNKEGVAYQWGIVEEGETARDKDDSYKYTDNSDLGQTTNIDGTYEDLSEKDSIKINGKKLTKTKVLDANDWVELSKDWIHQEGSYLGRGILFTDSSGKKYYFIEQETNNDPDYGGVKSTTYKIYAEKGNQSASSSGSESMVSDRDKIDDQNRSSSEPEVTSTGEDKIWGFSYQLHVVIKRWYNILRVIAVVGMMSALVYIGIRMVLSSAASDKAKYKQFIGDWLVGMCLLFTMNYIMVFGNLFASKLTNIFKDINPRGYAEIIEDENGKIEEGLKKYGFEFEEVSRGQGAEGESNDKGNWQGDEIGKKSKDNKLIVHKTKDSDGKTWIEWHTDLAGKIRILADHKKEKGDAYIGYTIMFLVMIFYTIMFAFTYIKRVIYMAFLTMIAPLVALTYPIDKANDGKAQGFNFWFKEYMFNLLLQPLHMLLFTILISSAIQLATENIVYALVAMGFIASAEKLLRTMFNFEKAKTPGVFAGPEGAALMLSGMKAISSLGKKSNNSGLSKGKDDSASIDGSIDGAEGTPRTVGENMAGLLEDSGTESAVPSSSLGENQEETSSMLLGPNGRPINGEGENAEIPQIVNSRERAIKSEKPDGSGAPKEITGDTGYSSKTTRSQPSFKDAFRTTMRYRGAQAKEKFKRRLENAKPIDKLGRAALGAGGAALFGTAALATGIASGDLNHAARHTIAGAAGGYALGSRGYNAARGAGGDEEDLREVFEREYYGSEGYKARKAKEQQEKVAHSEATIRKIQEKRGVGREEAEKIAEELVPKYMNQKINDVSAMLDIEKTIGQQITLENGKTITLDQNSAIGAYQISNMYNTENVVGAKREAELRDRISKDYNISQENAGRFLAAARAFDNVKNKRPSRNTSTRRAYDKSSQEARAKKVREQREKANNEDNPNNPNNPTGGPIRTKM